MNWVASEIDNTNIVHQLSGVPFFNIIRRCFKQQTILLYVSPVESKFSKIPYYSLLLSIYQRLSSYLILDFIPGFWDSSIHQRQNSGPESWINYIKLQSLIHLTRFHSSNKARFLGFIHPSF